MNLLIYAFSLIGAFYLLSKVYIFLDTLLKVRKLHRLYNALPADSRKVCKNPHTWMEIESVSKEGNGKTQICRACGLLGGMDLMFTPEALERIEESNKISEIEAGLYKEFVAKEDSEIKRYFATEIQGGLRFDKLIQVHAAGTSFGTRFSYYKMAKSKDIQSELNKGNA